MTIGEIIKTRRKELKMTQDDLATATNTTKATVSRWESGDIGKMKRSCIKDISRALQLDEWLFVQPHEILTRDEKKVLDAYRMSNDEMKSIIRKLLDVKEE